MSTVLWQRAKQLFDRAVHLPPEQLSTWLAEACEGDSELLKAVESLLAADESGQDPLPSTVAAGEVFDALKAEEERPWIGRRLGSYRIVEKIGQGGMGSVFLAERSDQEYRKRVAIKILTLWLTGPEILERFRQERQILAMLDHPHIARLLDGGTTEEGLPFLVMEFIEGRPLTQWCDGARKTVRERLEIFCRVCEAVSFAHQNLVVHRDLKPHNILVCDDGTPKLLDFGIAKLLEASDGAAQLTQSHQRLMTPDYASPEQILGGAVTTASDVYSLGAVLYELLCGTRPFPRKGRSLEELERRIETSEPSAPSATLARRLKEGGNQEAGTDTPAPETVAEQRAARSSALVRQLAGDLDNIALKALSRRPRDRYATARDLGLDVERYLRGKPVEARAAGWWYPGLRFIQRHAVISFLLFSLAVSIVGFGTVNLIQSRRIAEERDHARSEQARAKQIADLLTDSFELADPSKARQGQFSAREILETGARQVSRELDDQPELQATMLHTIGKVQSRLGLYEESRPLLDQALDIRRRELGADHPAVAESLHEKASLEMFQGHPERAEETVRRALDIRRGSGSPETAESLHLLAEIRRHLGFRDESVELHEEALDLQRQTEGIRSPAYVAGLTQLAYSLRLHGDRERAETLFHEALDLQHALGRPDHPLTARILKELSRLRRADGDLESAEQLIRRALDMNRRLYGEAHPEIASSLSALATAERGLGRPVEAEQHYRQALEMQRALGGGDNPRLAGAIYNLAIVLHRDLEQWREAEAHYREAIDVFRGRLGDEHVNLGFFLLGLGGVLGDQGRWSEAEPALEQAYDLFARLSRGGADGRNAAMVKSELGRLRFVQGNPAEARTLLESSVAVLAKDLGPEHAVTQRAQERLARVQSGDHP